MRKIVLAILAAVLLCAQTPMLPGFPPGVFQQRAALDSAASGGAYVGPGDVISGAKAWFGLRAYNAAYATANGNIADIVDTATGASSCTIKAKTNGDTDLTSALCVGGTLSVTTFCTVTHPAGCSITKLYDQTGANRCSSGTGPCDVVQVTLANMPTLSLNCINSHPCAVFNGSQSLVNATPSLDAVSGSSMVAVGNRTGNTSAFNGMFELGSYGLAWFNSANNAMLFQGSTVGFSATDNAYHAFAGVFNGVSSVGYADAVGTTLSPGTATSAANYGIGLINGGFALTGQMTEAGLWTSLFSSGNATSMCHNQFGYWGTSVSC